jgi:glucosamine--fructose-6-phosphate aminotransferase (isomerizing)
VDRKPIRVTWDPISAEKAGYKHFMLKEIVEQPRAVQETVLGRASRDTGQIHLNEMAISDADLRAIDKITLLACGTSWHSALVGKFMIEELAKVPVEVDYGSEYRYRNPIIDKHTLAVAITQSGETADTLAAMREAKSKGARSLSICNVVGSMATREAEGTIYTHAGPEIGVASTKAFTTQLVALYLFALKLAEVRETLSQQARCDYIAALMQLPQILEETLKLTSKTMEEIAAKFYNRSDFLYLGRGINYPIALEGALKLKEISYIHAEGYPAGEMKHGPIALIDENMPVVALATHDHVFEKMQGNIQEAKARGGSIIAITTKGDTTLEQVLGEDDSLVEVPATHRLLMPIVISLPLQLLSYYIAVRRGCDVDQPRNLAKSVTVE